MSCKVLLVDADVDALGALASALRARGLTVFNASDAFEGVEQAFQHRPDCVLLDKRLDSGGDITGAFRAVPELAETTLFYLVEALDDDAEPGDLARGDLDKLAARLLSGGPRDRVSLAHELGGNLEQMPLGDVLQLLSMNRRSGALVVTLSQGGGEVRLSDGDIIDASLRGTEGEKAFFRLLGESEGRFVFTPGDPAGPRRIRMPTASLLMEAVRQVDEVARRRRELAPNNEALMLDARVLSADDTGLARAHGSTQPPRKSSRPPELPGERAALVRAITELLEVPRSIDELLDDVHAPDLVVLEALVSLASTGMLRRVPLSEVTAPFALPEQLPVLRSLVQRLARAGFAPPPRIVIAAVEQRMTALAHSIRRIGDAVPPPDLPPRAPLPRLLGTLRLGDGIELSLIGLPAAAAFSPAWPLALAGAAAVVRIQASGGHRLEEHCDALELLLIDAESLMGSLDLAVPAQVASLVRSALEMAAGV